MSNLALQQNITMALQSLENNDQHHFRQALENLADLNRSNIEKQAFQLCKALWFPIFNPDKTYYDIIAVLFKRLDAED